MANRTEAHSPGVAKRVKDVVEGVESKTRDVIEPAVDRARAKVGDLQASLADAAESGAEALRERAGSSTRSSRGRVAATSGAVASRLEGTAYWLRENEVSDLGELVRQQVRTRPGRTALLVLGIGFLLGRASRR